MKTDQTEFIIKNLNKKKTIKEIIKICKIKDVKIDGENLKFSVPKSCEQKVEKVLQQKNIKVGAKRSFGILHFLTNTIFRCGIIIPILGCEHVEIKDIQAILNNNKINGIILKNNINTINLQQEILKNNKGVSLCSVIIKGNTLIVNIKEKLHNTEYEEKDNFTPILSSFNGIITEVSVVQGTALVKVGQTVKIGQELVAPYVSDTSGNKLSVVPMADIKADVFYTVSEDIPNTKIEYVNTNEIKCYKQIYFCNIPIYGDTHNHGFKHYDVHVQEKYLSKNSIPIKYVLTKYIKQKQSVTENYYTNNSQQILSKIEEKTRQLVPEYEIIKEQYHTVTQNAGIFKVTYTIVVNKSIC